jgi:hypothetical protein
MLIEVIPSRHKLTHKSIANFYCASYILKSHYVECGFACSYHEDACVVISRYFGDY